MLENRSEMGIRFELNPSQVTLSTIRPKVSTLRPIEGDEVGARIGKGGSWRAALVAGLGGMATQTERVQTDGTFDGNSSNGGRASGTYSGQSTVTKPDNQARQRSIQRAREIKAEAMAKSNAVQRTALRTNTVFPNGSASGFVYFKRNGDEKSIAALRVVVGAISFEFPITLGSSKQ